MCWQNTGKGAGRIPKKPLPESAGDIVACTAQVLSPSAPKRHDGPVSPGPQKQESEIVTSEAEPSGTTADLPDVSVVVIGRNEGPRLVRCLQSVRDAEYPQDRLELIYVDTNSTDDSCCQAEMLGAKVIRIDPQRPTAAAARNAGWLAARHPLIQFLDGDTILNRSWLRHGVSAIKPENIACVFGRRDEMAVDASIYNFWAHYDWYVPPGPADSCAGDALFRRQALERASGYDEGLIAGEEPDLCFRIRNRQQLLILSLDCPMTLHDMNMTRFSQYWKRCMRTGHAYAEVGGRHRQMTRWRRNRVRNFFYAVGTPLAGVLALSFWTPWPVIAWLALVGLAATRNAIRLRPRLGGWKKALLYSAHHYLAKTPTAIGQCTYSFRKMFRRDPQRLIEYRS